MLGDFLSTGLGVIGLSWQSSPALSEPEEVVTDWLRQMVGLSSAWSGVINDTASTNTLVALLCARERTTDYGLARGGLQSEDTPLVVYVSSHSHSSVEKAALLAGFGRDNLRFIDHDDDFAMKPDLLDAAIARDIAAGHRPCAIVATTGTTTTTAFDPISAIADIAKVRGVWLHVDAAMAGSAMILPECRWMWDGVEGAEDLVLGFEGGTDQPHQRVDHHDDRGEQHPVRAPVGLGRCLDSGDHFGPFGRGVFSPRR